MGRYVVHNSLLIIVEGYLGRRGCQTGAPSSSGFVWASSVLTIYRGAFIKGPSNEAPQRIHVMMMMIIMMIY